MSQRGEVLSKGCYSVWPDEDLVVEADGSGGATLMIVEGNYPIDYFIKQHQTFSSEDAACETADRMLARPYRQMTLE